MIDLFAKQATQIYKAVWEQMKEGKPLSGDAELIAEIMTAHPELDPFWTAGETAFQPQEVNGYIVNPLVHVGLHVTIEKQLDADDPVEVGVALKALIAKGVLRHEAIHQIAGIWGNLYFRSVRRGGPFEDWTYLQELTHLSEPAEAELAE
ncbi:MAG: DUF1841 family protein [Nitrospirota bacterium]